MESAQPVFSVKSVENAIEWYCKVLGFEVEFVHEGPNDPPNYAVLGSGDAGLHLGLASDMENAAGQGAGNFITREFDEVHQSALEHGATFYIELSQIPTGARTFGIKDPDGNLINFVEAT